MSETKRIIAKIEKLLAIADEESGASEQERETAMRQATYLMDKYALSMADIEDREADDPQGDDAITIGQPRWKGQCFAAIAKLYGAIVYTVGNGKAKKLVIVGRESARITVMALGSYVISSIEREVRNLTTTDRAYRAAFKKGAAHGVFEQVMKIMRERESGKTVGEPGKGLMVVGEYDKALKEANDYLASKGIVLSKSRPGARPKSAAGFYAGREYGSKLSLNNQISGNQGRKRIGRA